MTGGAEKIFGWAQIHFTLIFGREDQKKVFIQAVFFFFRSTSLAWGGGHLLPDEARLNLTVQISLLAQKFMSENQKKVFSAKSQAQSWRLLVFFRLGTKFLSRLEGHKQYLREAQAPKCSPVAPSLLFSFGAQSWLGGQ